eukprot:CAMPEP_0113938198 /NCGR_PEP_ID=MMETSP1339-20121228/4581_1 /TAXON_ID=94617 /ORGANISM="Fibrocapsa japonica" /LENGTH=133 /DNA_ID=CAMNT_0000941191 /DNA_START=159 /DNA_END=562 /DNA_ORIENTATION=- /assembly_acc=CAM_ASM_000762
MASSSSQGWAAPEPDLLEVQEPAEAAQEARQAALDCGLAPPQQEDQGGGRAAPQDSENHQIPEAIVGASLEEIKKRRQAKPAAKTSAQAAALKEVKDRAKAKKGGAKPTGSAPQKAQASKQKMPKGSKGGARR